MAAGKTWSVGDVLTAADMNSYVGDNFPAPSSSPPASPVAGDHWYALSGDSSIWHFIYYPAGDATYPWHFVGGPPWTAESSTDRTTSGTVQFADPVMTLPFQGIYSFDFTNLITNTINASTVVQWDTAIYDVTAAAIIGETAFVRFLSINASAANYWENSITGQTLTVAAANRQFKLQGHSVGWDQNSYYRSLSAIPMRVTA